MSQQFYLESALLPQGWTPGVYVTVAGGIISAIDTDASTTASPTARRTVAEQVSGYVIPGMSNAHSHAFQRAMVGNTEFRGSTQDSFWTWREAMYALANRIEPADLEILATQLFIEMLKAGYTSVAEFHYLHRTPDGVHYPRGAGLWDAVIGAAAAAGIGLTFLPTLYQTSNFDAAPLKAEQARFAADTDWFVRQVEERIGAERRGASPPATLRTGAAFHSLRAVPLATLCAAAAELKRLDATLPLHIHVAEQIQEVESCQLATGQRPIERLLETGVLDEHWCLVHATHATAAELTGIAASRAAVCVSISTEANLGDGFFDTARFLAAGGRLCIGSDSQATVCPAEELRWLEYQQRLRKKRRAVLAREGEAHVGARLWREAAQSGARAIGQPTGCLKVGRRADWLVLDPTHPRMLGATAESALDHLIFADGHAAIRDVMVAGHWVVKDHRHAAEAHLHGRFAATMASLNPRRKSL